MQVFISEKSTGDRNRSIAYLMRNFKLLEANIDETLDLYFQQCSVSVNAPQLALMAATLANGGVQPRSGREVFSRPSLRDVLTIMTLASTSLASMVVTSSGAMRSAMMRLRR